MMKHLQFGLHHGPRSFLLSVRLSASQRSKCAASVQRCARKKMHICWGRYGPFESWWWSLALHKTLISKV
jgi:hypothetical protein